MPTSIVTGGAGFIGSHIVDLLLREGHDVLVIDDLSTGRRENLQSQLEDFGGGDTPRLRFIEQGIHADVRDIPSEVDYVFHLAGRADLVPSIENPADYVHVNVNGTFAALELARAVNAKKFVYAASSTCYGIPDTYPTPEEAPCKPEHPYGLTKFMGEQLVNHWNKVYQLPTISLRLFNVYGPRSRTTGAYGAVFGVFLKQKLAGTPFTVVGDGSQTRDFTYVTDVASAFLAAALSPHQGKVLNVGSGATYPVNQLVGLLGGEKQYIPKRPGEPDTTFADTTKITSLLDWHPKVTFPDGVKEMLKVIELWKDAPLWTPDTIAEQTESWFAHLGHTQSQNHEK